MLLQRGRWLVKYSLMTQSDKGGKLLLYIQNLGSSKSSVAIGNRDFGKTFDFVLLSSGWR